MNNKTRGNGRGRYGRARTRKSFQRGGARDEKTSPFSLEGLREAIIGTPEEVTDDELFERSPKETKGKVEEEEEDAVEEDVVDEGEVADEREKTVEEEEDATEEETEGEVEEDADEKEESEPSPTLDTVTDVASAFSNYYGVDAEDVTNEKPDIEYKTLHEQTLGEHDGQLCFKKKLVKGELVAVLFHSSIGFKHGIHEYPSVEMLKKYTSPTTPVNVIVKQEKLPMDAEFRKGVYVATMALTLKTTEDVLPGTVVVCPYVPDMSSSKNEKDEVSGEVTSEDENVEEEVLMGESDGDDGLVE